MGSFFSLLAFAGANEPKLKPVTLQLKWKHQFNFAGYYAAKEKGYFKKAGLDVTIKEGLPEMDFIDEVVQGRADYGVEMPDLLIARASGKPIIVLAAIFQHSPYVLLASEKSGIRSPQDAVGKRVMMRRASAAELRSMFINEGVSLEKLNVVPHTWDLSSLTDGEVDAIGAYLTDQPFVLEQKGVAHRIIRPKTYGIDFYGDCLFTSEAKLESSAEEVKAFRTACIKGWEYAMSHPEELIQIIKETYKSEYSVEHMRYEYNLLKDEIILPHLVDMGHMNPGRWRHIRDTYKQLGMLPGDVSLDDFLYNPQDWSPKHWSEMKWVRKSLLFASIVLVISLLISAVLYSFNKRLQAEVKRQTREIQHKEEQFRAVLDNHFQFTGLLDTEGRLVMVNRAAIDFLGVSEEEVLGKLFWNTGWWTHSEEMQNRLKAKFNEALQGNFARFDATHLAPSGDIHYVDFSIKPIKDHDGRVTNLIPEGRDVTDQHNTLAALQNSESRYRTLFESANDGIFLMKDGVFVDCNERVLEMFGSGRETFLARAPYEFSPPQQPDGRDSMEKAKEKIDQALSGVPQTFEWAHTRADGSEFQAEVSLNLLTIDDQPYLQAIVRDVSERHQVLKALRESEQRFRAMVESAPAVCWCCDSMGRTTYLSPNFERVTGFTSNEILSGGVERSKQNIHPDDRDAVQSSIRGVLENGHRHDLEYRIQHKDGHWIWVHDQADAVIVDGDVKQVIGVFLDITESKQAAEQAAIQREQLLQADKLAALGTLVAGVAHEVNNPANFVTLNAPTVRDAWESVIPILDEYREANGDFPVVGIDYKEMRGLVSEMLTGLIHGGERIKNIVEDLKRYARAEAPKAKTDVDLNDVVRSALRLTNSQVKQATTQFSVTYSDGPLMVYGNQPRLEQVVVNLVINACQALRSPKESISVRVHQCDSDDYVCLTVVDEGRGMDPETVKHVCEPFYSTRRDSGGTGLGLSVSSGIIQEHDGALVFDSEMDRGTRAILRLPRSQMNSHNNTTKRI